jgi:predicted metal-binding membrane protein
MTRSLPRPILVGIAAAWAAAIAAQFAGAAALLHHDSLLADGGPPLAVAALLSLLAWQVMIAAMMLPSSLPLVRLYARASAQAPHRRRAMAAFLGGYALVWSGFGLAAFGADTALHAGINSSSWLEQHDWWIGGSVLALAGAFQFTSLKDACLDKCRHPGQFLMRYYERGAGGGMRLGMRHGAFCVGCCWALMLVMFAAGVASLIWMALLTAVMIHEKTRPAGARAVPVTGVALLAAASVVLAYSAAAAAAA